MIKNSLIRRTAQKNADSIVKLFRYKILRFLLLEIVWRLLTQKDYAANDCMRSAKRCTNIRLTKTGYFIDIHLIIKKIYHISIADVDRLPADVRRFHLIKM